MKYQTRWARHCPFLVCNAIALHTKKLQSSGVQRWFITQVTNIVKLYVLVRCMNGICTVRVFPGRSAFHCETHLDSRPLIPRQCTIAKIASGWESIGLIQCLLTLYISTEICIKLFVFQNCHIRGCYVHTGMFGVWPQPQILHRVQLFLYPELTR